ncbi:NAD(P)-binding protein [Apiospora rasikravindrae]|uniref:NAD(P)-binding protein n=1 Tax=Apiospora rasikravindrae TaxID=990691 RepID=A0ABR1RS79_9PEZI
MATYLVSGAGRGLGLELVTQLLASSAVAKVFATTRGDPSSALQELVDAGKGRLIHVRLDPLDRSSVEAALPEVESHLDGQALDVVINNVGHMPMTRKALAQRMLDLTSTFQANVVSAHNITSVFLPLLERGGEKKVVNISTTLGSFDFAPRYVVFPVPAYKIAKAALNMLTLQYAQDLAGKGFIVFAISPGWVRTDLGGEQADLTVEQSASAVLKQVYDSDKGSNGKFYNIHVPGWEDNPGLNQYPGGVTPW